MRLYKNFTSEELTVSIPIEDKQGTMFPIVTAGYTKIFEKILDHCGIRNRFTRRPELDSGGYIAWSLTEDPDMIFSITFGRMYNTSQGSWDGYTSVVMINNTWANSGGWNDTSFGYPKQVSYVKTTNHGWNAGVAWSQVRRVGDNIEFRFALSNCLTVAVFEKFVVFEIFGYTDQFLLGLTNKDKGYYLFYKNIHTGGLDIVSLHVSGTTPSGTAGDGADCPINNRFEDRSPGNEIMLFPFLFGRYVDRVSTEKRYYYGDRPNEADNLIMVNRESIGEYTVTNTRSYFDEIKIGSDIYTRVKGPIFSKCSMIVADDPTMNYID